MRFIRQTWTLAKKDLLLAGRRSWFGTLLSAVILPIIVTFILGYVKIITASKGTGGIQAPSKVLSLRDAFHLGSRPKFVVVDHNLEEPDVRAVINDLSSTAQECGKIVHVVPEPHQLSALCPASSRGVTDCFAAVEFWSSPDQGPDAIWNYTLHYDSAMGSPFKATLRENDVQIYILPLQHAVDDLIASAHNGPGLPDDVEQFEYAQETENVYELTNELNWDVLVEEILAFVFFVAMCGSIYHVAFHITSQREKGLLDLIDAMMPTANAWHCTAARILATHLSFDLIYLPGWIAMGVLAGTLAFPEIGVGWYISLYVLTGLALSSYSILFSSFFKKDQVCAVTALILAIVFSLAAQFSAGPTGYYASESCVWALSLLFPPSTFVYFVVLSTWPKEANFDLEFSPAPQPSSHSEFKASSVTGTLLFPLFAFQIVFYPILGGVIESYLHGHASRSRRGRSNQAMGDVAVRLTGVSKHYYTGFLRRKKIEAVKGLDLSLHSGSITVLCGVNASGKTTTLNAIAGLESISNGHIEIDRAGGVGLCPQSNVHWDAMTVEENIRFFAELKWPSLGRTQIKEEVTRTIAACDLELKKSARAKTLSGGQMRKLQLAMMLAGGSKVCCIDEASAGVDPLARRKVWEILLKERGHRTMLLTTHFLDESEVLSDHVAVLSRGQLKAEGSVASLKRRFGGDYHVILPHPERLGDLQDLPKGVTCDMGNKAAVFQVPASSMLTSLVAWLDRFGVSDYRIRSPTMEDVFLNLAEEMKIEEIKHSTAVVPQATDVEFSEYGVRIDKKLTGPGMTLNTGRGCGALKQIQFLFMKRLTVLKNNYMPYFWAVFLPLLIVGLVKQLLLSGPYLTAEFCSTAIDISYTSSQQTLALGWISEFSIFGPADRVSRASLKKYVRDVPGLYGPRGYPSDWKPSWTNTEFVNSTTEFYRIFKKDGLSLDPSGGFYLGEPPVFAFPTWSTAINAPFYQGALDMLATNMTWALNLATFEQPWLFDTFSQGFVCVAIVLGFTIYPGLFALYPTAERIRNVRAMQYSNGVLSSSLWAAHLLFDLIFIIIVCAFAVVIMSIRYDGWYALGYIFAVMFLYSIAATLYGYLISLWAKSQVVALACTSLAQSVIAMVFFVSYVATVNNASTKDLYHWFNYIYFTMGLICPGVSLFRALLIALNLYNLLCHGTTELPYPGMITLFGGPILYLTAQIFVYTALLAYWESGRSLEIFGFRKMPENCIVEEIEPVEGEDIFDDEKHLTLTENGVRLFNLTKTFGPVRAVENVNLGVLPSEKFALCGPNGAGKSTLISLVRGQLQPDYTDPPGAVWISGDQLMELPKAAKNHLGVCPQFDAVDAMTLSEHLNFYARVRGVPNKDANIKELITTLGLTEHVNKLPKKMSGGTRRKLSLAIALIANPSVLLLDEPTSGMDPAAKRALWATLTNISAGRSILLTTHSMEEAAALCDRAGIIATKMLALGPIADLCAHHGDKVYIQIVHENAPHTSVDDMDRIRQWAQSTFLIVETERRDFGGQLRFAVPIRQGPRNKVGPADGNDMGRLFRLIEEKKTVLGIRDYSIGPTTLDQVFLNVVSKHDVTEEVMEQEKGRWWDFGVGIGVPRFLKRRRSDLSRWSMASDDD